MIENVSFLGGNTFLNGGLHAEPFGGGGAVGGSAFGGVDGKNNKENSL